MTRGQITFGAALAVIALVIRVALGWQWIDAGLEKAGDSAWTGASAGAAVSGFLHGAVEKGGGAHPEVQQWFVTLVKDVFLPHAEIMSWLVTVGEIAAGIAILAGFFTKFSVAAGVLMNSAFLLAGTSSTNPHMLILGLILLAIARPGLIGADFYVMPALRSAGDRVIGDATLVRGIRAAGLAVWGFLLGFITYVMIDDPLTFAVIWATAVPFALLIFGIAPTVGTALPALPGMSAAMAEARRQLRLPSGTSDYRRSANHPRGEPPPDPGR